MWRCLLLFLVWASHVCALDIYPAQPQNLNVVLAETVAVADRYWIEGTSGNWNDTGNWSTTSGGGSGASVPVSGDTAIFDSGGTGDCDASAGFYIVTKLHLLSGYTGTVSNTGSNKSISVLEDLKIASGATLDIGTSNPIGLAIGTNKTTAASISLLDGTLTGINSVKIIKSNAISIASGTIDLDIRFSPEAGSSSLELANVIFNKDVTFDITTFYVVFDVENDTNNPDLIFQGDVSVLYTAAGTFTWSKGTGLITLSGTAAQNIDWNGETVEDIVLDKTAGTVTLTGNVITDSFTGTDGTLDIDGNNLETTGNFTAAAGTVFNDTTGGGLITVGGNFDINGISGTTVTWNGPDLDVTGTADADWTVATNSDATGVGGTEIDATTDCTDGTGNTNWNFGAASASMPVFNQRQYQHVLVR